MGIAEVYVADYTLNREITSSRHRFGPGLETGMITEITFFDGNVEGVESLKRGDIIYLKNVLVHSRQGSLQGRLKFEGKDGPSKLDGRKTWSILPRDHSHAMKLARRREASIGRVNRGEPYQPMPEQEDVPLGMPSEHQPIWWSVPSDAVSQPPSPRRSKRNTTNSPCPPSRKSRRIGPFPIDFACRPKSRGLSRVIGRSMSLSGVGRVKRGEIASLYSCES